MMLVLMLVLMLVMMTTGTGSPANGCLRENVRTLENRCHRKSSGACPGDPAGAAYTMDSDHAPISVSVPTGLERPPPIPALRADLSSSAESRSALFVFSIRSRCCSLQ